MRGTAGDLESKRLIVLKGLLFLVMAFLAGGLLIWESPRLSSAVLVVLLAWASARFYYFLFYVLHSYVDPAFTYSGVMSLLRALVRVRRPGPSERAGP